MDVSAENRRDSELENGSARSFAGMPTLPSQCQNKLLYNGIESYPLLLLSLFLYNARTVIYYANNNPLVATTAGIEAAAA